MARLHEANQARGACGLFLPPMATADWAWHRVLFMKTDSAAGRTLPCVGAVGRDTEAAAECTNAHASAGGKIERGTELLGLSDWILKPSPLSLCKLVIDKLSGV